MVQRLQASPSTCPHDVKQQENVLAECAMMVTDCRTRLASAEADLRAALARPPARPPPPPAWPPPCAPGPLLTARARRASTATRRAWLGARRRRRPRRWLLPPKRPSRSHRLLSVLC